MLNPCLGAPRRSSCEAQGCLPALLWHLDNHVGNLGGPQGGVGDQQGATSLFPPPRGARGYSCPQPGFLFLVSSHPPRGRSRKWSSVSAGLPQGHSGIWSLRSHQGWYWHPAYGGQGCLRMLGRAQPRTTWSLMSAVQALETSPEAGGLG